MRYPIISIFLTAVVCCNSAVNGADPQIPQVPQKSPTWLNVELSPAGELVGQILDNQGAGVANAPMVVQCGKQLHKTTTNQLGQFKLTLATGGMCQLQVDDNMYFCRVWKHGTAPPNSISSIALVQDDLSVVRGNLFKRNGNCQQGCECEECRQHRSYSKLKGTAMMLGLGGVAAYMALSRDNASE